MLATHAGVKQDDRPDLLAPSRSTKVDIPPACQGAPERTGASTNQRPRKWGATCNGCDCSPPTRPEKATRSSAISR